MAAVAPVLIPCAFLVAPACSPEPAPSSPPPPSAGPRSCGVEVIRLSEGYDAAARACIWEAYKARSPAEFKTTRYTIEGDPITYTITITGTDVVVVVDSKDRFGQRGVFKHSCRNFEQIMQEARADRFGFALSGCSGAGAERLAVP